MKKSTIFNAFKKAYLIRTVETIISENYHKGFIRCPTHLSIGQELVPSILHCLNNKNDLAVSTHRSHGHYLGKGGSVQKMFDELHGLPSGCSGGKGGSMHLIDTSVGFMGSTAIVGNTIPVGVGMAEAQKLANKEQVTYIFLGDGATEEGVFFEALNYASVRKLPCIFVIENNGFSVYTSLKERQSNLTIENKVKGFDVYYAKNINHDFIALYKLWEKGLQYSKESKGPSILEIFTHRYLEHCGPNSDDNLGYRSIEFLNDWKNKDILSLFKESLLTHDYSISEINQVKKIIKNKCLDCYKLSEKNHISLREVK